MTTRGLCMQVMEDMPDLNAEELMYCLRQLALHLNDMADYIERINTIEREVSRT